MLKDADKSPLEMIDLDTQVVIRIVVRWIMFFLSLGGIACMGYYFLRAIFPKKRYKK